MDPHIVICMNDMIISMEYKYYKEYECGSFKRNSSVAPFSLFISFLLFLFFIFLWPHWLFLFISQFSSFGIFCLSSFRIFCLTSLRSFPHFKGNTLYFTRSIED